MECEEHENSSVTAEQDAKTEDGREKSRAPQIQRSVAFDLSTTEDKTEPSSPVRRVTIRLVSTQCDVIQIITFCSDVTINKIDCDTLESQNVEKAPVKAVHKDSTSIKKEIIGILKPPNLKKELKSFPSLPECFLHDLGLLENLALR